MSTPNVSLQLQAIVNNPFLSILTPYAGGSAVKGLYRFQGGVAGKAVSLKDLSGNGNHLTEMGSPIYPTVANGAGLLNGVSVNNTNGFLTPFLEQLGYSYFGIARPRADASGITTVVGNFATGAENRGTALGFDVSTGTSVLLRHLGRYKSNTGAMQAGYITARTVPIADRAKWAAFGATVLPATQSVTTHVYDSTTGVLTSVNTVWNTGNFSSTFDAVSGRKLTQLNDTPIPIGIGYTQFGFAYADYTDVLEVIIYDATLPNASATLQEQIALSLAYWNARGEVLL